MVNAFVADDGQQAWDLARSGVLHQLGAYEAWDAGQDTPEHDSLETDRADEHAARRGTAAGTPEDVLHALRPLVAAYGSRKEFDLIVRLHYPGMAFDTAARAVELFGERVLPALKGE
jgi:alkanesulfonate monooxygenase SsuD/methylene tetrahydromethanopterin reductase-like flavin-dependent oxidoreductase (luciferase family)